MITTRTRSNRSKNICFITFGHLLDSWSTSSVDFRLFPKWYIKTWSNFPVRLVPRLCDLRLNLTASIYRSWLSYNLRYGLHGAPINPKYIRCLGQLFASAALFLDWFRVQVYRNGWSGNVKKTRFANGDNSGRYEKRFAYISIAYWPIVIVCNIVVSNTALSRSRRSDQ